MTKPTIKLAAYSSTTVSAFRYAFLVRLLSENRPEIRFMERLAIDISNHYHFQFALKMFPNESLDLRNDIFSWKAGIDHKSGFFLPIQSPHFARTSMN